MSEKWAEKREWDTGQAEKFGNWPWPPAWYQGTVFKKFSLLRHVPISYDIATKEINDA